MTATAKVSAGKVKVLTLHTSNLQRAFENYYQKAFYLEKDICASVGLALKTLKKLQAAKGELENLLKFELPAEVKEKAVAVLEEAQKSIEKGLELKKRLKEFEAATNVYRKNPTEENRRRVEAALEALAYPTEGNKTLKDYVESCNPWKKYLKKRVDF